ncbi:hypothetical protein Tco_0896980 [Tanacetum coccineum]
MIKKSGFILEHEKNLELHNALIGSIGLDETITKGKLDPTRVLKKRCHDDKDQDPPADSEKEKKRRRRKDTEPSNKQTTSIDSSKCAEIDVEELVEDDVVNVEKQPQDDVAPKDKITKADLEGLAFKLLKRTCRNNIELEYNLEHCYLTLSDQLDLVNPKGDRCPYALSKPLPLPHSTNLLVSMWYPQIQSKLHHLVECFLDYLAQ